MATAPMSQGTTALRGSGRVFRRSRHYFRREIHLHQWPRSRSLHRSIGQGRGSRCSGKPGIVSAPASREHWNDAGLSVPIAAWDLDVLLQWYARSVARRLPDSLRPRWNRVFQEIDERRTVFARQGGVIQTRKRGHLYWVLRWLERTPERTIHASRHLGRLEDGWLADSRQHYVSPEVARRLIDVAPDTDWQTIIALSRFGGLRCPSEVLSLKWEHVDWEQSRMRVPQPKLGGSRGRPFRVTPIFGTLRPYLEQARAAVPEVPYVVANERYRQAACSPEVGWKNANLRSQLLRIIQRAGFTPWPRLFHNRRSSLATDLVADFPPHLVARWLGHTEAIAEAHYGQATGEHFAAAAAWNGPES